MSVQLVAFILLCMRLVSLFFVSQVLWRQIRLFRLNIDSDLVVFRVVMFMLGCIFALGHILPIITDIYYSFFADSDEFNILVYYAISNAISGLVASILLWNIYRIAGKELDARQERADAE